MKKLVLLALFACSQKKELPASPTEAVVTKTTVKEEGDCEDHQHAAEAATTTAGEKLKGETQVALTDLFTSPEKYDSKTIATEGTIRKVCQKSGCWMEIAGDLEKGPGARITFKDYAFFVPKDARGQKVKLEGAVKLAELSEERAKHYEGEGGTIPRGKDGKAREVQIVATGVEIKKI